MNELYEALKGFTDLPLAILSLIFGILCYKKMKNKAWATLFFIIAVAATLGAVVHGIALPDLAAKMIWVVLYPLLFEAVRRFGVLFGAYLDKENKPLSSILIPLEIALYIGALFALFLNSKLHDILVFAVYAVIVFIIAAVRVVRAMPLPKLVTVFLVLLAFPILLQICESFIPYAVVIEHSILVVEFAIAYRFAITSEKT